MKNVLLISYYFPPMNSVASLRAGKLAKYLPSFGWQPWVLTVVPSPAVSQDLPVEILDDYIIRTKYLRPKIRNKPESIMSTKPQTDSSAGSKFEKLYQIVEQRFRLSFSRMPDRSLGWYPYAIKTGRKLVNRVKFDAIFSTHGPPTCHLIGRRLQKDCGLPWIADYRDFWSLNHYHKRGIFFQWLEERFERWVVQQARTLVVVNKPMEARLAKLTGKTVVTITNGFDDGDFDRRTDYEPISEAPFSILYAGSLYPEYQNPLPLFWAIQRLDQNSFIKPGDLKIRFLGTSPDKITKMAEEVGITPYLEFIPVISFDESVALQKQSTALLLLKWNDELEDGVCPVKLYEYLGANRPVLSIGNYLDVTDDIMVSCQAGVSVQAAEEIIKILRGWITIYRQLGELPWNNNYKAVQKYSRKASASELSTLLNEFTENICLSYQQ
jgi:glycosyltransferase involved in cell wall biosynthesis